MALVINEKYFIKGQAIRLAYKVFIEARAMRLYPFYALMLVLSIIMPIILFQNSFVTAKRQHLQSGSRNIVGVSAGRHSSSGRLADFDWIFF